MPAGCYIRHKMHFRHQLMPVTSLVLLGFTINTVPALTVDMSPARKIKLLDLLTTAVQVSYSTPRFKMQIGGWLQSAELCLGPTITMFLSEVYLLRYRRSHWRWFIPQIMGPYSRPHLVYHLRIQILARPVIRDYRCAVPSSALDYIPRAVHSQLTPTLTPRLSLLGL